MIAKYFATSLAIEKVVSAPRVIKSCLPISTTSISLVGFESRSTMLPASRAACVPVFMATPTSACASAGASLVPSPHIATSLPLACSARMSLSLSSGVAWARKSSTPASAAIAAAVIDHDGADAHAAQLGEALTDAALDDVLEVDHAKQPAVLGDRERRAAGFRDCFGDGSDLPHRVGADRRVHRKRGRSRVGGPDRRAQVLQNGIDSALADPRGSHFHAAHAAVGGEGDELAAKLC